MRTIVLASSSPRRRELLERAHVPFVVDPADIEEDMQQKLSPEELVKSLALEKARAVTSRHPDAIVIAADTIVAYDGRVYGKPKSEQEARDTLRFLSGKQHEIWTGFALLDTASGKEVIGADRAIISFRDLSENEIAAYVARNESLDAAGGYAFQKNGSMLSDRLEGDFNTVLGLPLSPVLRALKGFGVSL
jgi:septum formation protein